MKKYALAIFLAGIACLPAAAQQPDLNVWLTLAGTKQQVLDTLEKRAPAWEMIYDQDGQTRFKNSRKDVVVLGFVHDTLAFTLLRYFCHSPYGDIKSLNHFLAIDTTFYIGKEEITENKIEIQAYQFNDCETFCDERDEEQFRNCWGGYQRLDFMQYNENILTKKILITKQDLLLW